MDRLTAEQQAVVSLSVGARTVVIAGPGTGKTYTLVRRVAELSASRDIAPGSELLVLSFTNVVVDELRRRLGDDRDGAYVRLATIDSFASSLVARAGGRTADGTFDSTIKAASALIQDDSDRTDIQQFRHVIIDEVQDLTGVRLEFIDAVLAGADGGFTLFGDPAQSIYDFQAGGSSRVDAVTYLSQRFPEAAVYRLTVNHRARNSVIDVAHTHRDDLVSTPASGSRGRLVRHLLEYDHLTVEQLAMVLWRADARTGVLCRSNGEVLALSQELHARHVDHQVRRPAQAATPARWIAETLGDASGESLSRRAFDRLTTDRPADWVEMAWRLLRRVASDSGTDVSMSTLRERLAWAAQEPQASDRPVLSTIHRSKGLEYDRTVVMSPDPRQDQDEADEARVLFVALTRSRDATLVLERPRLPGVLTRRVNRWALLSWRKSSLIRVELRSGDVDISGPAGGDESAAAVQNYIRESVHPGDPVELISAGGDDGLFYILHDGRAVGSTSPDFGADLRRFGRMPVAIEDIRVDCLRSAAGDPSRTLNLGLGSAGLWLAPELVGFGKPIWRNAAHG